MESEISFNNKKIISPEKYHSYNYVNVLNNSVLNYSRNNSALNYSRNNKIELKRGLKRTRSNQIIQQPIKKTRKNKKHTIYLTLFSHGGIQTNRESISFIKDKDNDINERPLSSYLEKFKLPDDIEDELEVFNKITFGKFNYKNYGDDDVNFDHRNKFIYKYLKRILHNNYFDKNLKKGIKDFKKLCHYAIDKSKKQSNSFLLRTKYAYEAGYFSHLNSSKLDLVNFRIFLSDIKNYLYSYYYENKKEENNKILLSKLYSYSEDEKKKDLGIYIEYASGGILKDKQIIHFKDFFNEQKNKYQFTLEDLIKKLLKHNYNKIYLLDLSCNVINKLLKNHKDVDKFHETYPEYIF
jgi:hypothetical protein